MAEMIHYLDNAATTAPSEAARNAAVEAMNVWGNPSSRHLMGTKAKKLLEASRDKVASALGIRRLGGGSIVFTASGTEANVMATLGFDAAKVRTGEGKKPLMIITDGEHPSIENPAKILESRGWKVVRIPTVGGELDLADLREAVSEKCTCLLAAFMLINNETGAVYDVKRAATIVRTAHPDAHVHCDAVQAFLKVKLSPQTLGVDTLTVSAHKIHAPRGAAALYISPETVKKKNIAPVIPGGGQEMGMRSGTENLISIAAFAAAAEDGKEHLPERMEKVLSLREYLNTRLHELEPMGIEVKTVKNGIPDIASLTLPRIKSETMLNFLSGKGICASAGSACSAGSGRLSSALRAFGCPDDVIDSSLRISLSYTNTEEDIDALCKALAEGAVSLQKF